MSIFVEFGGQSSKNVHDVRKVYLEMTLCVLACFIKVYMFVLDDLHVRGPKKVYYHNWVGNVRVKIPKDQPRVLDKGPFSRAKAI